MKERLVADEKPWTRHIRHMTSPHVPRRLLTKATSIGGSVPRPFDAPLDALSPVSGAPNLLFSAVIRGVQTFSQLDMSQELAPGNLSGQFLYLCPRFACQIYSKLRWSVNTIKGCLAPSNKSRHSSNTTLTANSWRYHSFSPSRSASSKRRRMDEVCEGPHGTATTPLPVPLQRHQSPL